MATKYEIKDLNLYYGNFHGLKNINLSIPEKEITALIDEAYASVKDLEAKTEAAPKCETPKEKANYAHDILLAAMRKLRAPLDSLELIVAKREWPLPSYGDLLFHTV